MWNGRLRPPVEYIYVTIIEKFPVFQERTRTSALHSGWVQNIKAGYAGFLLKDFESDIFICFGSYLSFESYPFAV